MMRGNWSVSAAAPVPPTASGDGQEVLEFHDLGAAVPHHADADLVIGAADPVEPVAVELRGLVAEQRIEAGAAADGADHRAVLVGDVVEPVGEPQAAGAFHVLRRHRRIAGNVLAEVARDQPRVDVVAAADAVADHHLDGLALVELGRRLGGCAAGAQHGKNGGGSEQHLGGAHDGAHGNQSPIELGYQCTTRQPVRLSRFDARPVAPPLASMKRVTKGALRSPAPAPAGRSSRSPCP